MKISRRSRIIWWIIGVFLALGALTGLVLFFILNRGGRDFIVEFFSWSKFKKTQPYIMRGLGLTIEVAIVAEILILIFGLLVALVRISRLKVFRVIGVIYIDFIRGIPLLVQILIVYYGIGALIGLGQFPSGVIALTVCYAAYEAEIFRAGIESIHKGQMEAARSLGMGYLKAMRHVVLPQAVRNVIPPLSNEFIALVKDTSLLSVIALLEVTRRASEMAGYYAKAEPYVGAAIAYLLITIPLMRIVQYITNRLSIRD
jgi:His/Glu/Gln/Arg/opine family amino acid ABC transporter permease subunit